jgi:hypothetical protein
MHAVLRLRFRDPVLFYPRIRIRDGKNTDPSFFNPESGIRMGKFGSGFGSGINIPDPQRFLKQEVFV